MANAVSGQTRDGQLTLFQYAGGGAGGDSHGGQAGSGGAAESRLVFDDTHNASQSAAIDVQDQATAGDGGAAYLGGGGGDGGKAVATLVLHGTGALTGLAYAAGGKGGAAESPGLTGDGGSAFASATLSTTGAVNAQASAFGGVGQVAGTAEAMTTATGTSGLYQAWAQTGYILAGHLVDDETAVVSGPVNGTSSGEALAGFASTPAWVGGLTDLALETGNPDQASVSAVLSANPNIAAAAASHSPSWLAPSWLAPSWLAIDELGVGDPAGNALAHSSTSRVELTAGFDTSGNYPDLWVGLDHPVVTGASFTSLTVDIYANGGPLKLLHQVFATAAAAEAYFTDHPIHLGSLAGYIAPTESGRVTIDVSMTATYAASGGGAFDAGVILFTAPSAQAAASLQSAAQEPATLAHPAVIASAPVANPLVELSDPAFDHYGFDLAGLHAHPTLL